MLSYGPQSLQTPFSAVTLTAAYADNLATIETEGLSELIAYVSYTTGAAETDNSIQLRVQGSPARIGDTTSWYQDVTTSASSGTVTVTPAEYSLTGAVAATVYTARIMIPVADKQIRLAVKETGVAANFGTCTIELLKSGRS